MPRYDSTVTAIIVVTNPYRNFGTSIRLLLYDTCGRYAFNTRVCKLLWIILSCPDVKLKMLRTTKKTYKCHQIPFSLTEGRVWGLDYATIRKLSCLTNLLIS